MYDHVAVWDNEIDDYVCDPITGRTIHWSDFEDAQDWINQQIEDGDAVEGRYSVEEQY